MQESPNGVHEDQEAALDPRVVMQRLLEARVATRLKQMDAGSVSKYDPRRCSGDGEAARRLKALARRAAKIRGAA